MRRAAAAVAALCGLPPPPIRDNRAEGMRARGVRYRGEPIGGGVRAARFALAGAGLNLLEPDGGPSPWSDWLAERGPGGCYLAFAAPDPAAALRGLAAIGFPAAQTGRTSGGAAYGYADARAALGVWLEILPLPSAPAPPPAADAPRLAAIAFDAPVAGRAAAAWARVAGLAPDAGGPAADAPDGGAALTLAGGVRLALREREGAAPRAAGCTLAAARPARGADAARARREAPGLLGLRVRVEPDGGA